MQDSWWLYLLGGGAGGSIISALISKIKGKGDKEKDKADVLTTITNVFENTLKMVQASAARAVEASDNNFKMSMDREQRLLEIIRVDAEYKTRMENKIADLDKKYAFRGDIINKSADCKYLKNKPNTDCPVIKANIKGLPADSAKCDNCDVKVS